MFGFCCGLPAAHLCPAHHGHSWSLLPTAIRSPPQYSPARPTHSPVKPSCLARNARQRLLLKSPMLSSRSWPPWLGAGCRTLWSSKGPRIRRWNSTKSASVLYLIPRRWSRAQRVSCTGCQETREYKVNPCKDCQQWFGSYFLHWQHVLCVFPLCFR